MADITRPTTTEEEYELILSYVREAPVFLPNVLTYSLSFVWMTAVGVSILSAALYMLVSAISKRQQQQHDHKTIAQFVCQLTNFLVNLVLGVAGVYYFGRFPPSSTVDFHVLAIQYNNMAAFPAAQVGYQIWAVLYGFTMVQESPLMLVHHMSAMLAAPPAFFTVGFRYYSPFFGGVTEVSSIPLAIMNMFKRNKDWIARYPTSYSIVRALFAASFLYLRCYLWIKHVLYYLRLVALTGTAATNMFMKGYLWMSVWAISLLTLMQIYWGILIVQGFCKTYIRATITPAQNRLNKAEAANKSQ